MIKTIEGRVSHYLSGEIVIAVNGLGYLVSIPTRYQIITGETKELFTYHHIKENVQALFGFETLEELKIFEQLLTVPSIGPKLALAILSAAKPEDIRRAVDGDNIGFFQSLPGVGKKSAAKIIVELKDKLSTGEVVIPTGGSSLTEALQVLGYDPAEIQPILKNLPSDLADTESQVAWALKQLA